MVQSLDNQQAVKINLSTKSCTMSEDRTPIHAVLIATLGAEPQVVSLATQLLLQQGIALQAVVVIHTSQTAPPILHSLPRLHTLFAEQSSLPPLHTVEVPIADVLTLPELEHFSQTL